MGKHGFVKLICSIIIVSIFASGCNLVGNDDKKATNSGLNGGADAEYKPQRGGTLNLGLFGIDTLNPILTQNANNIDFATIIYDTLVKIDNNLNVLPGIAERFEISPDAKTYTFFIRAGVKFHDGKKLTAKDVEYTFDEIAKPTNKSLFLERLKDVDGFRAISDNTFVINLKRPKINFLNLMDIPILPNGANDLTDAEKAQFKPIGTGRYMVVDTTNVKTIRLKANSAWWGGEPYISDIVVKKMPDKETAAYAFKSQNIDFLTPNILPISSYGTQNKDTLVASYPSTDFVFLAINNDKPVFAGRNIRKGIAYAIDRANIINEDLYGYGAESAIPMLPNSVLYGQDTERVAYSAENAKRSFSADGFEDFDNDAVLEQKDGDGYIKLKFEILVNKDNLEKVRIANMISEQLKKLGVWTDVANVSWEEYNRRIAEGKFDSVVGSVNINRNFDLGFMLHSTGMFLKGRPVATNDDLQNIFDNLTFAWNSDYIISVNNTLSRYLVDYMPIIGICFKTESVLYNDKIVGIKPNFTNVFSNINEWYIKKQG